MAEIVNLRRARKAKARTTAEDQAAANRAKFGTPKALHKLAVAKTDLADKRLEGHKLDDPQSKR